MKQVRKQVDAAYRAIIKRIEALMEVNGNESFLAFVGELNQYALSYNNLIAQRQGRNAKSVTQADAN